jgi:hypothetical protein
LKADDLDPPDQEMIAWCKDVIAETAASNIQDLNQLQNKAPLLFAQLAEDAESEDLTPAEYLTSVASLDEFVRDLADWCQSKLARSERFEQATGLIPTAIDKLSCPLTNSDLLSKYQTTLDNQTYKAIKALREAQDWRLKMIETAPTIDTSDAA